MNDYPVDITVARTHNGAWQCSAIVRGQFTGNAHLVTRTYYGYTRPEAVEWFRHNVACEWPRVVFSGLVRVES